MSASPESARTTKLAVALAKERNALVEKGKAVDESAETLGTNAKGVTR